MKNIMYDTIKTTVLIDTKFKKVKLSIFDITNVAVVPIKNNACSINSNCCFCNTITESDTVDTISLITNNGITIFITVIASTQLCPNNILTNSSLNK